MAPSTRANKNCHRKTCHKKLLVELRLYEIPIYVCLRYMQNESRLETIEYLRVRVVKLCRRGGGDKEDI